MVGRDAAGNVRLTTGAGEHVVPVAVARLMDVVPGSAAPAARTTGTLRRGASTVVTRHSSSALSASSRRMRATSACCSRSGRDAEAFEVARRSGRRRSSPSGRRGSGGTRASRARTRPDASRRSRRSRRSAGEEVGERLECVRTWRGASAPSYDIRSTAAPVTRSAARSRSASSARSNGYGVVVTRMGMRAAIARNSSPSRRVLAVTLRSAALRNRCRSYESGGMSLR